MTPCRPDIREAILARRRQYGVGIGGSCEVIARWLYREYGVLTSTSTIAQVIAESKTRKKSG